MDRVAERVRVARRALGTLLDLDLSLSDPPSLMRHAAIQRFEYSLEGVWKAAKGVLSAAEGIDVASPRSAVRECFRSGMLDEAQARRALDMVSDRNLTVHTYNEELAIELFGRLGDHARLMSVWLNALDAHLHQTTMTWSETDDPGA